VLHSRKLQYINEIVRCGSIRKAAARLNVASSAVNRQILALEEELGAPLFERLPRGLRLTAAGELCVEHIRDVLKNYEKLESRIRGLKMPQAGKVTLVTTVGLASGPLPLILARFLEAHPRVRIQLRNDGGSTTINPVLTGEVDIGLGFNIPATPGIRTLTPDVPVGVVLPPGYPLSHEAGPSTRRRGAGKTGARAIRYQPANIIDPAGAGAAAGRAGAGTTRQADETRSNAGRPVAAQPARRDQRGRAGELMFRPLLEAIASPADETLCPGAGAARCGDQPVRRIPDAGTAGPGPRAAGQGPYPAERKAGRTGLCRP
jgi:DNA-binding transcriptional LysR family regulator